MILLEHHNQAAATGDNQAAVIGALDEFLDSPLPAELTREQMERADRDRVAAENEAARERLLGIMSLPRSRQ